MPFVGAVLTARTAAWIGFALCLAGSLITYEASRGAWLSLPIFFLYLLLFGPRRRLGQFAVALLAGTGLALPHLLRWRSRGCLKTGSGRGPGSRAVVVRPAALNGASSVNGYERGLLLPEQPAPSTPATLILPTGWYQPGRRVELRGGQKQVAKLGDLLEKGSDFERCTFTLDQNP